MGSYNLYGARNRLDYRHNLYDNLGDKMTEIERDIETMNKRDLIDFVSKQHELIVKLTGALGLACGGSHGILTSTECTNEQKLHLFTSLAERLDKEIKEVFHQNSKLAH